MLHMTMQLTHENMEPTFQNYDDYDNDANDSCNFHPYSLNIYVKIKIKNQVPTGNRMYEGSQIYSNLISCLS